MKVTIIKPYELESVVLPKKVFGDFWLNYKDINGVEKRLIGIQAENGKWKINGELEIKELNNQNQLSPAMYLEEYGYYYISGVDESGNIVLYCSPDYEDSFYELDVLKTANIVVGKNNGHIKISCPLIEDNTVELKYENSLWSIANINAKVPIYINGQRLVNKQLKYGDIIFLLGINITLMKDFIIVSNPINRVFFDNSVFTLRMREEMLETLSSDDCPPIELYSESDYFYSSPRLRPGIETLDLHFDAPPTQEGENKNSMLLTIGPMLTMGLVSIITGYVAINRLASGTAELLSVLPSLVMSVSMILSTLLWPTLSRSMQKKQRAKREKERLEKYGEYLKVKTVVLKKAIETQSQALHNNFTTLEECKNIILEKKNRLWERKPIHRDFLELRLGLGNVPIFANISAPREGFTMNDDELRKRLEAIIDENKDLRNVPVTYNFVEKNLVAIIGKNELTTDFVKGLLLQIMAFHNYENVKVLIFTNDKNKSKWDFVKDSPHCWNNERTTRFFASNQSEYKEVAFYLENALTNRLYDNDGNVFKNKEYNIKSLIPYYVIITDDYQNIKNLEIIKTLTSLELNIGTSFIQINDRLSNFAKEITEFIYVDKPLSGVMQDELLESTQKSFAADFASNIDMVPIAKKLMNVPIKFEESESNLPPVIGFLQMYEVGKVEQLNVLTRWAASNPTISLQAPIGYNLNNDLFILDLHERFHGPHGLIAGMTGSGKSELIITFILSMAINYHPHEVSFVLIDYKGGGLSGVFDKKDSNLKLPHLAGSITNLETVELNRALTSIQSELRKRQSMFNEVRDKLGESVVDIYKYQKLYREGLVEKPISHLFIISDEFAELKTQQPEFMDQLISTARIGRSLGVHLILATQKPSGIVNDQIWSNSKFRICLKVQERNDSVDVIKRADAADLKNPGRFYLQVGYNEYFALGQSAWAGGQYYPSEKPEIKVDNGIDFIDNTGNPIYSYDDTKKMKVTQSKGEEVTNIIQYLIDVASHESIQVDKLWLDKISDTIYVNNLKNKYNYVAKPRVINPIIGEYDDPFNQRQDILTLPLSEQGNTIVYGIAGSGKENLLTTMLYSIITEHDTKDVNIYILDLGAESLKMFENAPQVGDVIISSEKEKIINLFKKLSGELEARKKILSKFGGTFFEYIKNHDQDIPLILVVLNNYEVFNESFDDLSDQLQQLTREGAKYGITFVFTANSANAVRYKMQQNFRQFLTLQFTDTTDYVTLLGRTNGLYPSSNFGRGLVKLDEIYEYQTAFAYKLENLTEYIREICQRLAAKATDFAPKIPILPERVSYDTIKNYVKGMNKVPVGITQKSLEIETYDFKKNFASIITSFEYAPMKTFVTSLLRLINTIEDYEVVYWDFASFINSSGTGNSQMIKALINRQKEASTKTKMNVVIGIEEFVNSLDSEKENVENFLTKEKDQDVNYIFIDTADKFRIYEFETWFKKFVNVNSGIWVGEGAGDQNTIRITKNLRLVNEKVAKDFGFMIERGNPKLIKLLNFDEKGDSNE